MPTPDPVREYVRLVIYTAQHCLSSSKDIRDAYARRMELCARMTDDEWQTVRPLLEEARRAQP